MGEGGGGRNLEQPHGCERGDPTSCCGQKGKCGMLWLVGAVVVVWCVGIGVIEGWVLLADVVCGYWCGRGVRCCWVYGVWLLVW